MKQRECVVCESEFVPRAHNQRCCSPPSGQRRSQCSARWNNHQQRGTPLDGPLPEPFDCEQCGERCVPGENVAAHATKFCGRTCKKRWHDALLRVEAAERKAERDFQREREALLAPPTKRQEVAYRKALRSDPCAYCGGDADALDHIVPKDATGEDGWANRTAACRLCNSIKGTLPLLAALLFIPPTREYHRLRRTLYAA